MKKLALFDFDKTLISIDSIVEFKKYCELKGFIISDFPSSSLPFNVKNDLLNQLNKQNWLLPLVGLDIFEFDELCSNFVRDVINKNIISDVLNYLIKLKSENIDIIIISATYSEFIKLFFDQLEIKNILIIANELMFKENLLLAEYTDLNCSGINKFILLNNRINLSEYNLSESYGFTDHISDISFLSLVGKKYIVKNKNTFDNWSHLFNVNYIYH